MLTDAAITEVPSRLALSARTLASLLPPPRERSFDWICRHVRTKDGMPFNPIDYPWTEGICDEFDNPRRKTIWLQFAARLGKSQLAMSLLLKAIAHMPAPAMIGTSTESLLKETIRDKLYPMFERTAPTRRWVPARHLRSKTRLDLLHAVIYGAWSGSVTSLADKDPRYKWGFEIDKWSSDSSTEADPLELFFERGIEIPDRKSILESTPAVSRTSRIYRGLVRGTNCRFLVPCKHCGTYQQLVRGSNPLESGGVLWDKDASGKSTPNLAYQTARYVCRECHREIHDEDRRPMIRRGKWCPAGCSIDKSGELLGTPLNDGPDASFQLSRLYAPTFSFGDYAKHWVECQGDPDALQNHVNSWDGEVWEPVRVDADWREVAKRLCVGDYAMGVAHPSACFLTAAIDVQVDHWVYMVIGWGPDASGWVVDWGIAHNWDQVKQVLAGTYSHAGGSLPVIFSLVDARDGNRSDEVIAFCKSLNQPSGPWVYPSMGQDSAKMSGKAWYRNQLDDSGKLLDKKSKRRGLVNFHLLMINTGYWEAWAHNCLFHRTPGESRSLGFPSMAAGDQDLFEQLLNVAPDETDTPGGDVNRRWIRVDRGIPKDFRDCARYARVAAEVYCNGNWGRVGAVRKGAPPTTREQPAAEPRKAESPQQPSASSGGSGWVRRTERDRFVRRSGE